MKFVLEVLAGAVPDLQTRRFLQDVGGDKQLDARRQQVAALLQPLTERA